MFPNMNTGAFRAFGIPVVNIFLNGIKLNDWISFKVDWNGMGDVDSFEVTTQWDVGNEPRNELFYSGVAASAELVKGKAVIKIEGGFEGEEIKQWIEGDMDYPEWDFANGETVKLVGRSYASRPYDYTEEEKYQNMTATEAHAQICEIHGFTPVVPVPTSGLIGEYSNDDHSTISEEMSHWDYVLYLAEQEGFVSRVTGTNWYFGPLDMLEDYQKEPLPFTYGHNIRNLKIKRAPNAARNFKVEVVSWQSGNKKGKGNRIIESVEVGDMEGQNAYTIRRYIPNITREQAQKQADNIRKSLEQQQFSGSFDVDYFPEITNDRRIVLYGVGNGLSQVYHVSQVTISGDKSSGLLCSIEFTNILDK